MTSSENLLGSYVDDASITESNFYTIFIPTSHQIKNGLIYDLEWHRRRNNLPSAAISRVIHANTGVSEDVRRVLEDVRRVSYHRIYTKVTAMKAKHKPVKEFLDLPYNIPTSIQVPPLAIVAKETRIVVHSKQLVAVHPQLLGAALGSCMSQMHETRQQLMTKEHILADRENYLKRKDEINELVRKVEQGGKREQETVGNFRRGYEMEEKLRRTVAYLKPRNIRRWEETQETTCQAIGDEEEFTGETVISDWGGSEENFSSGH